MALTYINKGRYTTFWNNNTQTWGTPQLSDLQRWEARDTFKSALLKNPRVNKVWRDPSGYERRMFFFSGCDVTIDAQAGHLGGPVTRMFQNGADSLGDVIYPSLPAFPQNLEDRAVNEALSSLKNQKIHLGVAFGERKETAEFVTSTALEAAELMRALRKKDLKAVKNQLLGRKRRQRHHQESLREVLEAPSKLLLQNSYAISPLTNDAYGAMELLNDKDMADPKRYATKATKKKMEQIYTKAIGTRDVYYVRTRFAVEQHGYHGCFVRLDYYIENPLLSTLATAGITNPAEIAWELVPFSFVADWFLPIGQYLSTLDATLGLKFRGGSVSRMTRSAVSYRNDDTPYTTTTVAATDVKVRTQMIKGYGSMMRLTRTKLTSSPAGRLPHWQNPFSYNHLANALALLTTLTSK